jgi:hypothetical protein
MKPSLPPSLPPIGNKHLVGVTIRPHIYIHPQVKYIRTKMPTTNNKTSTYVATAAAAS